MRRREKALLALGFQDYRDYLNSDLWRKIKANLLEKRPNCELCGNVAITGHHKKYMQESLTNANDKFLVSICQGCHYHIEFDGDGKKNSQQIANTKMLVLMTQNGHIQRASALANNLGCPYKKNDFLSYKKAIGGWARRKNYGQSIGMRYKQRQKTKANTRRK